MLEQSKQQIALMVKYGLKPSNYLVLNETETALMVFDKKNYKRKVLKKEIDVDCVYMKVTKDKYEYPLEIADSVAELARITGVHIMTIYRNLKKENSRYKKVDLREVE